MNIIKNRERHEVITYMRSFEYVDMKGAGVLFECDINGNVDIAKLKPAALDNYNKCLNGTHKVIDKGIIRHRHSYIDAAIIECVCGSEVILNCFTNTCDDCERDYNGSGQLLASRECWGEETGESLSDILSIK